MPIFLADSFQASSPYHIFFCKKSMEILPSQNIFGELNSPKPIPCTGYAVMRNFYCQKSSILETVRRITIYGSVYKTSIWFLIKKQLYALYVWLSTV